MLSTQRFVIFPLAMSPTHRVLAIDTDPTTLSSLKGILESEDHIVDVATTAAEAQAALDAERYDLVIAEINMPGLPGQALFEACEARAADSGARIIYLAAGAISPEQQAFLDRAKRPCLVKPIHLRRFLDKVEDVLLGTAGED